jgi:hypothetical protein
MGQLLALGNDDRICAVCRDVRLEPHIAAYANCHG